MIGYRATTVWKQNRIGQVKKQFRIAIQDALMALAEEAASIAYQLCPVDTGYLRDSIAVERSTSALALYASLVVGAEYATFVELGTSEQAAQPFVSPAIAAVQKRAQPLVKQYLRAYA